MKTKYSDVMMTSYDVTFNFRAFTRFSGDLEFSGACIPGQHHTADNNCTK